MKLTLTCECGNTETIEVNQQKMNRYVEDEDSIYLDDFEEKNNRFNHKQSHPDESTIHCQNCSKFVKFSI